MHDAAVSSEGQNSTERWPLRQAIAFRLQTTFASAQSHLAPDDAAASDNLQYRKCEGGRYVNLDCVLAEGGQQEAVRAAARALAAAGPHAGAGA